MGGETSPYEILGELDGGRGSPPKIIRDFLNPTENSCPPRPTWKKTLPLHFPLQGPKFNIYVHFHLVKK